MAPSLFNASRLPASRTLPAPSSLGNLQTANLQRRSLTARAHNPVRLAVVEAVNPPAINAHVHSGSSDEEDIAHSSSRIISNPASSQPPQPPSEATTPKTEPTTSLSPASLCSTSTPAAADTTAAATSLQATSSATTPSSSTGEHACVSAPQATSSSSNNSALRISTTSEAETGSAADWSTLPSGRDHNSVTIKENTNVKDAAGAVVKVLSRLPNVLITALRMDQCHESLNRAVKSIAVARKYVTDERPDRELSFLPVNRSSPAGCTDPNLFAFLCFKIQLDKGIQLLEQDKTDLNVSRGSNANAMANAIIRILKERGQAVMKAGGAEAIFIAMSAVINARFRLKRSHNMDAMVVPAWITEDTTSALGRESKFLRLNILPCAVNGPFDSIPA